MQRRPRSQQFRSQQTPSPQCRRFLSVEPLDPRLMLSASPWTSTELTDYADQLTVEQVGSRTSIRGLSVPIGASVESIDDASRSFLDAFHADLGLPADVSSNLETVEVKHGLGSSHVRFRQVLNGLPVYDGFVSVHTDSIGNVQTIHNAYVSQLTGTTTQASVTSAVAIAAAEQYANLESSWFAPKSELVLIPQKENASQLAWDVTVYGQDREGQAGDFQTLVDAMTGAVISQQNIAAFDTGTGDVFIPNPYQTQGSGVGLSDSNDANSTALTNQLISVTLQGLDSGTGRLRGEYVDMTLTGGLGAVVANEPSRIYQYTRNDDRFEDVVVYHALDSIQRYIHSLGFDNSNSTPNGIRDFPTRANAHWYTADNSFYSTGDDAVHFGDGGVDDAEDADIVAHEYGHAIQHDQNSFWGGGEMGAMGEAFGDYLAASFYADQGNAAFQANNAAAVGEWDATSYSSANPPNLRRVDTNNVWPDDLSGEVHYDGQIWSSALWNIRNQLGGTVTDTLVLEHHFGLPAGATMRDAANAMIQVDINLYGGVHESVLQTEFEARGILGDVPPDDHGNNAATATLVSPNSSHTGTIEFPGNDTDWFAFNVPAGAHITLSTVLGSLSDTVLTLYNTNGTSQLAFDDDGGPGLASLINYTIPANGTYFAAVGSYGTGVGSYTLNIASDATLPSGDFDADGDYDCDDINALTNEIAAGTNGSIYDLTSDGIVNINDLTAWRVEAGAVLNSSGNPIQIGDANLDGSVDGADFVAWNGHKFQADANWCDGDFDASGVVDGSDFLLWNSNKFTSADSAMLAARTKLTHDQLAIAPRAMDVDLRPTVAVQRDFDPASKTGYALPHQSLSQRVNKAGEGSVQRNSTRSMLDLVFATEESWLA